jgi:hypothetical protein
MRELINRRSHPVVLEDGTVLAAAGTPGSVKQVDKLTERELGRLVEHNMVQISDLQPEEVIARDRVRKTDPQITQKGAGTSPSS